MINLGQGEGQTPDEARRVSILLFRPLSPCPSID